MDPLNMPIVTNGVMHTAKPIEREKYKRITKQELHDFVRWLFTHVNDEGYDKMSCGKIANMYFQETGKYISRQTVVRNRHNWFIKDGKIMRID